MSLLAIALVLSAFPFQQLTRALPDLHDFHRLRDVIVTTGELPVSFGGLDNGHRDGYQKANMFGLIDELPGIQMLMKSAKFRSSFTVYTAKSPRSGLRIPMLDHEHIKVNFKDPIELAKIIKKNDGHQVDELLKARVARRQVYPFDLSALKRSGFDPTQTTRVLIGGYLTVEHQDWMQKLVELFRKLDPKCNIIKFSWEEGNHGLYENAAHNSRLAGRHLTVFLHYLDQLVRLNLDKLHLIGHSLGSQIAGVVGADFKGKIARITGLDPAGPFFADSHARFRLDQSDAKFIDVFHTNAGELAPKGQLGTRRPSGHVDYFINGGSVQPGCGWNLGIGIHNTICSHGRSVELFTAVLEMELRRKNGQLTSGSTKLERKWPTAYLVEYKTEFDKSGRSVEQPTIVVLDEMLSKNPNLPPPRWQVEVTKLQPGYPKNARGVYVLSTRSTAPYFGAKQFIIQMRTEKPLGRDIALSARLGEQTIFFESSVRFDKRKATLMFVVEDPQVLEQIYSDQDKPLTLSMQWHEIGLVLFSQNVLNFESIQIRALEPEDESDVSSPVLKFGEDLKQGEFGLYKSVWHQLEGRVARDNNNNNHNSSS